MFLSDQGVQYSAKVFRDKLALLNISQSMRRRGNCWDNTVMERFFRRINISAASDQVLKQVQLT